MVTITDPFFRSMYAKLEEELSNRAAVIVAGGSIVTGKDGIGLDPMGTAMRYQAQVSYIEALQFVIELGLQMDRDQYGTKTKDEGD